MEYLKLNSIKLETTMLGTKVMYDYDAPACFNKYTKGDHLFIEYPGDLRNVPESILTIPFVGIMLTVGMLLNISICVPSLDEEFYRSIGRVETVFRKMYPRAGFHINLYADILNKLQSPLPPPKNNCSLFFTGGVDATSALAELAGNKPLLINIWGGDIRLTDCDSHEALEEYLEQLTKHLGLDYCFIKTNAREMFKEDELGHLCGRLIGKRKNHGWWASIAHILTMVSATMPWLYFNGINDHYIGSSYDGQKKTLDANNDDMVAAISIDYCVIHMADYATDRNEKIKKIIDFNRETGAHVSLKVCWNRTAGRNCSDCEKCYRTILGIISNHGNPNDLGFDVGEKTLLKIKSFLSENLVNAGFWRTIIIKFQKECEYWRKYPELAWILEVKLNSFGVYARKIRKKLFHH